MVIYADLFFLINGVIDFLLLMGSNRLCEDRGDFRRCILGGAIGGFYATMCILPGFLFLGNTLWRLVFLILMCLIAYGFRVESFRKSAVFVILCMALGGIGYGFGSGSIWTMVLSALLLIVLGIAAFRLGNKMPRYVPVELDYKGETHRLTALVDTGNLLRDPITGQEVLVLNREAAENLIEEEIRDPVALLENSPVPGLRLIPFRSIGNSNGMMAGLKVDDVRIAGKHVSTIVGFAPYGFGKNSTYQALTGGISI